MSDQMTPQQEMAAMIDIVFGTALIIVLLEAVRRTLGIIVPIIIGIFTVYAVFGPWMPLQILQHPGSSWSQYINNMYFPAEGIFGVTLWIVSTVVSIWPPAIARRSVYFHLP